MIGAEPLPPKVEVDYLARLREDYEAKRQRELAELDLLPRHRPPELSQDELLSQLETCRGQALSVSERAAGTACFRKLRPTPPDVARAALDSARRRLGIGRHIREYTDALERAVVQARAQRKRHKPSGGKS